MFSRNVRFLLILGLIILLGFYIWSGYWLMAFLMLIGILTLLYGYFKHGTVYLANRKLKKDKVDRAEQLLEEVRRPELLSRSQRAYYYFCKGVILLKKEKSYQLAQDTFQQAIDTGLRSEQDEASAYLNMAVASYQMGKRKEARKYLKEVKSRKQKPFLKINIAILERALNQ